MNVLSIHMMRKTEELRHRIAFFGLVMMISYPLFGVFWKMDCFQQEEEFWLRLCATFLSACLGFNYLWPKRLVFFLPLFWYLVLLFCLPFFFTYLTLINAASTMWLMNCMTAIFILSLITSILETLILLLLGSGLAFFCFFCDPNHVVLHHPGEVSFFGLMLTFSTAITFATFFAPIREKYYVRKLIGLHAASDLPKPRAKPSRHLEYPLGLARDSDAQQTPAEVDASSQPISIQLKNMKNETWDVSKFKIHHIELLLSNTLDNFELFQFNLNLIHYQKNHDFLVWIDEVGFKDMVLRLLGQIFSHSAKGTDACIEISLQNGCDEDDYNYFLIKYRSESSDIVSSDPFVLRNPFPHSPLETLRSSGRTGERVSRSMDRSDETMTEAENSTKNASVTCLDEYKSLLSAASASVSVEDRSDGWIGLEMKFPKVD